MRDSGCGHSFRELYTAVLLRPYKHCTPQRINSTAPAPLSMEWITELDGIVEEYDCHPFAFTMLGRLPTELRQIVIDSLPRHSTRALQATGPRRTKFVPRHRGSFHMANR